MLYRTLILGAALALVTAGAPAQTMPGHHSAGSTASKEATPPHAAQGVPPGSQHGMGTERAIPTLPGQDAFGAVQEIVRILEADPATDWSRVALDALRQHLVDMNEVTLRADAAATEIDGGVMIAVTGSGRTLAAIQRLVPHHAAALNGLNGWSATAEPMPDGVRLRVTAGDPAETRHIRGLGFIGLMVSGGHHQPHHLAMARGESSHTH